MWHNLNASYGRAVGSALTPQTMGKTFYVKSSTYPNADMIDSLFPADIDGVSRVFSSITSALAACTADQHDVILVAPWYTETVTAASGLALNVAGVSILGLGAGAKRPTITLQTSTAATIAVSAANVVWSNMIVKTNLNLIVSPVVVTGAGAKIDIEMQDAATNKEAITGVLCTTVSNLDLKLKYLGQTGGSNCARAVRLNGCSNVRINIDFYGKASTAVVNFTDVLSSNVNVSGYMYNSGTTDGSKDIVDTISGSLWSASIFDGAAGAVFDGGSGSALSKSDSAAVLSTLAVPTADATTNANERDVIGNKTDAAVTAVGTTKSVAAYAKGLVTMNTVQGADSTNNAFAGDVIGNKTDAAVYTPWTTKSLLAYAKGHVNMMRKTSIVSLAASDLTGTVTRFTIANGPIRVFTLGLLVTTAIPAGANTLKLSFTPTGGGATDLCGATDTASAGGQQLFMVDGTKATALVKATDVGILAAGQKQTSDLILGSGVVQTIFSAGAPASGAAVLFMEWEPLNTSVTVS